MDPSRRLLVSCILGSCLGIASAQEIPRPLPVDVFRAASTPTPGLERRVVIFESRDFTLDRFRDARRADAKPDTLRAIIADFDRDMRRHQQPFVDRVEELGGTVYRQWWIVNACAVEAPREVFEAIELLPNVLETQVDRPVHAASLPHPRAGLPLIDVSMTVHGVRSVHASGNKGDGEFLAVIDSGQADPLGGCSGSRAHAIYYREPALLNKLLIANKQVAGAVPPCGPNADHGTSILGIAAGQTWAGAGALGKNGDGQAPHAYKVGYGIAGLALAHPNGLSNLSIMTQAWQDVLTDAAQWPFTAGTISYQGTSDPTSIEQMAMDSAAYTADILVTAAAGNHFNLPTGCPHTGLPYYGCRVQFVEAVANGGTGLSIFRSTFGGPWIPFNYQVGDTAIACGYDPASNINGEWTIVAIQGPNNEDLVVSDPNNLITNHIGSQFQSVGNKTTARCGNACVNGLSVGSVSVTKTLSDFSVRGPLPEIPNAIYPHITAVGEMSILPKWDDENAIWEPWGPGIPIEGTSAAAPQVAGAALLAAAADPFAATPSKRMRAVELKAILLASAEDITSPDPANPSVTLVSPGNELGVGMLRTDRAVDIATNRASHVRNALMNATTDNVRRYPMDVVQGRSYTAAVVWNRQPPFTQTTWSFASASIRSLNATAIPSLQVPGPVWRLAKFTAPYSGRVWVEVTMHSLQPGTIGQEIGFAHNGEFVAGAISNYGNGCDGNGTQVVETAVPNSRQSFIGNSSRFFDSVGAFAQVMDKAEVPAGPITGVTLREGRTPGGDPFFSGGDVEIRVQMGTTTSTPTSLQNIPANNLTSPVTVVSKRWVRIPRVSQTPFFAPRDLIYIPFDVPYTPNPASNTAILFDITTVQTEEATTVDAVTGSTAVGSAFASSPTTPGLITNSAGWVLEFEHQTTQTPVSPRVHLRGWFAATPSADPPLAELPALGRTFRVELDQALPSTAVTLNLGGSDTIWGTVPLPWDWTGLGAPGCTAFASGEVGLTVGTDSMGRASIDVPVPTTPSLVGGNIFFQWMVLDPTANALGVVLSDAGKATIGSTDYSYE